MFTRAHNPLFSDTSTQSSAVPSRSSCFTATIHISGVILSLGTSISLFPRFLTISFMDMSVLEELFPSSKDADYQIFASCRRPRRLCQIRGHFPGSRVHTGGRHQYVMATRSSFRLQYPRLRWSLRSKDYSFYKRQAFITELKRVI